MLFLLIFTIQCSLEIQVSRNPARIASDLQKVSTRLVAALFTMSRIVLGRGHQSPKAFRIHQCDHILYQRISLACKLSGWGRFVSPSIRVEDVRLISRGRQIMTAVRCDYDSHHSAFDDGIRRCCNGNLGAGPSRTFLQP